MAPTTSDQFNHVFLLASVGKLDEKTNEEFCKDYNNIDIPSGDSKHITDENKTTVTSTAYAMSYILAILTENQSSVIENQLYVFDFKTEGPNSNRVRHVVAADIHGNSSPFIRASSISRSTDPSPRRSSAIRETSQSTNMLRSKNVHSSIQESHADEVPPSINVGSKSSLQPKSKDDRSTLNLVGLKDADESRTPSILHSGNSHVPSKSLSNSLPVISKRSSSEKTRSSSSHTMPKSKSTLDKSSVHRNGSVQSLKYHIHVVRASFSQASEQFSEDSQNRQCSAISMVAMAYAEKKSVRNWTPEDLDTIINIGDDVFLASNAIITSNENYLSLDEVIKDFKIDGTRYHVELRHHGEHYVQTSLMYVQLIEGFEKFFITSKKGVLFFKSSFVSFFLEDEYYYLFDSHSRDANGLLYNIDEHGYAGALVRFNDIRDMAELIIRNSNDIGENKQLEEFEYSIVTDSNGFAIEFTMFPVDASYTNL